MSYPQGVDAAMLKGIDACLGVRDAVGAIIRPVYFLTRTWYSDSAKTVPSQLPEGYAVDAAPVQLLPSPGIKDFSQDIRTQPGGAVRAGDLILRGVSKNKYKKADLDRSSIPNVEKLYLVGDTVCEVINITEKHVTFSVQVRELTNQTRY